MLISGLSVCCWYFVVDVSDVVLIFPDISWCLMYCRWFAIGLYDMRVSEIGCHQIHRLYNHQSLLQTHRTSYGWFVYIPIKSHYNIIISHMSCLLPTFVVDTHQEIRPICFAFWHSATSRWRANAYNSKPQSSRRERHGTTGRWTC